MTPSLTDHLLKLEDSGLIQLAKLEPDLEYLFRHALVQDATYESLLRQDRRALHRTVGETLERLYPDRLATLAPALAHHYDEAHDSERALHYATMAADHAFAQYANEEAIAFYTRALEIASTVEEVPSEARIHLYRNLGRARELRGEYEQALTIYEAMENEGTSRADSATMLAALTARATIQATPTPVQNPDLSIELSERAIALARTLGDRAAESRNLWNIGLAHMYGTGQAEASSRHMEQSLAVARELHLDEQIAYTLTDLGNLYSVVGSAEKGLVGLKEARGLWRSLDNKPMLCFCLSLSAEISAMVGDLDTALAFTAESAEIASSIGNAESVAYTAAMTTLIYLMRGDMGQAIRLSFEAEEAATSVGSKILSVIPRSFRATTYAAIGACEQATEIRDNLLNSMRKLGGVPAIYEGQMLIMLSGVDIACVDPRDLLQQMTERVERLAAANHHIDVMLWGGAGLAEAHLRIGDLDQALAHIDRFLSFAQENDWHSRRAEALEIKARVLHALGRMEEEYATLTEARAMADRIGLVHVQWRVYAALAENEDRDGNGDEAANLRREARAIVDRIASSLDDPHLKRGFFALPEVRALIRGGSAA